LQNRQFHCVKIRLNSPANCPPLACNEQGLAAGGASTAARTGAKLANLHKLSGELLPRLRQTQVARWL